MGETEVWRAINDLKDDVARLHIHVAEVKADAKADRAATERVEKLVTRIEDKVTNLGVMVAQGQGAVAVGKALWAMVIAAAGAAAGWLLKIANNG